jgi:hypothetical protein
MAKKGKSTFAQNQTPAAATCTSVAARGISTGHDFANFMSALMSDLIEGRVTPAIGNAACNAAGKLLKVVELQFRYGTQVPGGQKVLQLAMASPLVKDVTEPAATQ